MFPFRYNIDDYNLLWEMIGMRKTNPRLSHRSHEEEVVDCRGKMSVSGAVMFCVVNYYPRRSGRFPRLYGSCPSTVSSGTRS